jgi:hypothetical protein
MAMSSASIETIVLADVASHDQQDGGGRRQIRSAEAIPSTTGIEGVAGYEAEVPDGGYGWIVITACAIITWWFVGTTYSWGIIQAALVGEGLARASTLSFVGSLTVASIAILAIANAKLVTAIGAQKTGLLGIGLLAAGEILGGFATRNVGGLFATVGVLMGVGTR